MKWVGQYISRKLAAAEWGEKVVPKLVVLTEWGYEFGRAGLNGRTQFTRYVANELNSRPGLQGRAHAAVTDPSGKPPVCPEREGVIVILPADIGLRIQLPDLEVFVESVGAKGTFLDYRKVCARESAEHIDYLACDFAKRQR
jgi:hypothetical protein